MTAEVVLYPCRKCGEMKATDAFYWSRAGNRRRPDCKSCISTHAATPEQRERKRVYELRYVDAHRDTINETRRIARQRDPERFHAIDRRQREKRNGQGALHQDHIVYRFYNHAGELLYVGMTYQWQRRRQTHVRESPWFSEVTREEIEHFDSEDAAADAEIELIRALRPRYNQTLVRRTKRRPRKPPATDAAGGRG